jgi:Neuraminidase (sialidase)
MKKNLEIKELLNRIRRRSMLPVSVMLVVILASSMIVPAVATSFSVAPLVLVSGQSPFTPGCNGAPQTGTNYLNAEVEPWVAVNPTNLFNIIGVWQQDRWSNGGSNGLLTSVSHDGGATWTRNMVHFSRCSGGNASNGGDYERASDPWVTISPNGSAYQIGLSLNNSNMANGVLVSKSTDSGNTWSEPITLKRDMVPTVLNDKESITADPTSSNFVYAVWDRLVFPSPHTSASAAEHSLAFRGPIWFSRTADGGQSWDSARIIFDPGEQAQTIGNQIVVLPNGDLVDIFNLIYVFKNASGIRGENVAIIRSTDKGVTWSKPIIVSKLLSVGTGQPVRTGNVIPEVAVDSNSGSLYAVWQDGRFSSFSNDHIAFSMSTDGGLTWSEPVKIDKTPLTTSAFTPSVHVADDGVVGVIYYDFRNNTPASGLPTDYWLVHCHTCIDPANWLENHVAGSFDMETAPVAGGFFIGDYEGLSNIGNRFLPFFVQTNSGNINDRTDVFATTVGP